MNDLLLHPAPDPDPDLRDTAAVERRLVDPVAFGTHGYPWALWRRMRQEAPLFRCDGVFSEPFWAVTRHADVQRITRDAELFTNRPAPMVRWSGHEKARRRVRTQVDLAPDLLELDSEEHRAQRMVLIREVVPRMTAIVQDGRLDQAVARALAPLEVAPSVTFDASQVGCQVPMEVMCLLLELPLTHRDELVSYATRWAAPTDGAGALSTGEALMASTEGLTDYFGQMVTETRRGRVPSRLLATLADTHATVFSDDRALVTILILLLVAGFETTKHALAGGLHALATHPDQFDALRRHPQQLDASVEEVLRWTTPLVHFARTASSDFKMHGQHIRQGDRIVLFYPSANRDDEVFEAPDSFDISRNPNPHLSFGGGGVHHCLGTPLARAEIAAVLRGLVARVERLEIASPLERIASNFVGGPRRALLRGHRALKVSHG